MAIDFQPIDFEPANESISFEPVEFEPVEETKKKGLSDLLKAPDKDYLTSTARALVANVPGTLAAGGQAALDVVAQPFKNLVQGKGLRTTDEDVSNILSKMERTRKGLTTQDKNTLEAEEKLGAAMAVPGEAAYGAVAPRLGEGAGTVAQVATDVLMNIVDPALIGKAAMGARGRKAPVIPEKQQAPTSRVDSVLNTGRKVDFEPVQLEMFPQEAPAPVVRPAEAGAGPVLPERGALANRRQAELPLAPESLPEYAVTHEGVALAPDDTGAMVARNAQQDQLIAQAEEGALAERTAQMENAQQLEMPATERQMDLFNEPTVGPYDQGGQANLFSSGFDLRNKDGESAGFKAAGLGGEDLGAGYIGTEIQSDGKRIGGLSLQSAPDAYTVLESGISPEHRGSGLMSKHYADVATHALETGKQLHSDKDVSTSAARVYESLEKKGFTVDRNPSAKTEGDRISSQDGQPVFKVTAAPLKFPELSLAPMDAPVRKFTPNSQDKNGAPLEVSRTVEQSGIGYKAFDEQGNLVAQVSFEQNPDGSVGAGHVQSFAPGRGVAESLYRKAKEDGLTIRPGRAQTEQGAGLVRALQKKGLVEPGPTTPVDKYFNTVDNIVNYEPSGNKNLYSSGFDARDKDGKSMGFKGVGISGTQEPQLNVLNKIPGMKEKLGVFEPDLLTTEEFMAKHGDAPDINQNALQRAMNATSKGGQYVAARTNDPYIRRATQRVRTAVNRSQAAIRDLIHSDRGGYAPLVRSLDRQEFIEVSQLLQKADKENIVIDTDAMREHGFSEKAIAAVEAHKAFTEKLKGPLKEAAELAGIKDVDMRVAYAASRANHDFRVPVMNDKGVVVGILTAPTRGQLAKKQAQYKKQDGSVSFGPEQYFGGARGKQSVEGFSQLYQWLADQNPEVAKFADTLMDMNTAAAANFMGAKKHTMAKKGVFGMAGDDPTLSPYDNAKDFWASQVKYGENVIKWAELSKAAEDIAPLVDNPNRPNANEYIKEYLNNALGKNPSYYGRAIDSIWSKLGKDLGIGTELGSSVVGGARQAVNTKLLAFSPAFLAANVIQPMKSSPEIAAFLRSRGITDSWTGLDHYVKGSFDALGFSKDPVVKQAIKYAEDNHVYSSDLFEHSNRIRKDFGHYFSKLTVPASKIESATRQTFYLGMVDALRGGGYTPENGLFQTAQNLTDLAMNNYNATEQPLMYNIPGKAVGGGMQNLMSFKQNELSRIAMFIEEARDKKAYAPLVTALMAQVAVGGLMGTVGYTEADWFIRKMSELMGKPTSLTDVLLTDKTIPDMVKYGVGAPMGIDLTSRMGLGQVLPEAGINAVMPGLSSLGDTAVAAYEAAKDPTEYNLKKAVREALPIGPMQGAADLAWFSPEGMALNQNKGTAQVKRTPADVKAKAFGVTGIEESKAKKRNYEEQKIEQFYADKRKNALDQLGKALITQNESDKKTAVEKYVKFRGDPNTLNRDLDRLVKDGFIDERTRAMLAAQSGTITNAYKLKSRSR